jgi:hypothetical protein
MWQYDVLRDCEIGLNTKTIQSPMRPAFSQGHHKLRFIAFPLAATIIDINLGFFGTGISSMALAAISFIV